MTKKRVHSGHLTGTFGSMGIADRAPSKKHMEGKKPSKLPTRINLRAVAEVLAEHGAGVRRDRGHHRRERLGDPGLPMPSKPALWCALLTHRRPRSRRRR